MGWIVLACASDITTFGSGDLPEILVQATALSQDLFEKTSMTMVLILANINPTGATPVGTNNT
jgi:hypothetical protein